MTYIQLRSIRSPFDGPRLASAAIGALRRADAMGLLDRMITSLDVHAIEELRKGMADAGIGMRITTHLRQVSCSDHDALAIILENVIETP